MSRCVQLPLHRGVPREGDRGCLSLDAGVLNMRTPRMEFSDCYPRSAGRFPLLRFLRRATHGRRAPLRGCVAPSGGFAAAGRYAPETEVIGVAVLNIETCIAYRSSFCAFCHDVCIQVRGEENAASTTRTPMRRMPLDTRLPVVDAEKCNGCGACEAVCVSAQAGSTMNASERAIVVKPLEG